MWGGGSDSRVTETTLMHFLPQTDWEDAWIKRQRPLIYSLDTVRVHGGLKEFVLRPTVNITDL